MLLIASVSSVATVLIQTIAPDHVEAQVGGADNNQRARQLRTDSKSPYYHRLTLYDHDGEAISPEDGDPKPYSARSTCGKCHAYDTIACGWHFGAGITDPEKKTPAGRIAEPWVYLDRDTGTALPLSLREWPGSVHPERIGMTRFQFAQTFGRHLPGGGWIEPSARTMMNSPQSARWGISGAVEIDCMVCHATGNDHDMTQAERNLEPQNFKWIPTIALGIATVRGKAKDVPDDYDPFDPTSSSGDPPPSVEYRPAKFDGDDRVHFDITLRPSTNRCNFCHSERIVGATARPRWQHDGDVHIRAGLSCVDCHRNGIDHQTVRGYEEEATHRPEAASFSCRGCHLGEDGGHFGAPKPQHAGLPPLHLTEMSCTTCHSGPAPQRDTQEFQTARLHGLGIPTKHRHDDDPPSVEGPLFLRDDRSVITPYRSFAPSYWARRVDATPEPLTLLPLTLEQLAVVQKALTKRPTTEVEGEPTVEIATPLDAESIAYVCTTVTEFDGELVYVHDGQVSGANGAVDVPADHPSRQPYRWAIGHDVRPARQSLGVGGCTDCHAKDAALFHGRTDGDSVMYELFGTDPYLVKSWEAAVAGRVSFKWLAWPVAGLIALIVLASVVEALRRRLFREPDIGPKP